MDVIPASHQPLVHMKQHLNQWVTDLLQSLSDLCHEYTNDLTGYKWFTNELNHLAAYKWLAIN